jgi:hypothetical protein
LGVTKQGFVAKDGGGGMRRYVVPISLLLLLGFALVGLAVPRTVAAWKGTEGQPARDRLDVGQTPTAEQLTACIEANTRALRWELAANRLFNLGSCEYAVALAKPRQDRERGEWLQRAEQSTVRGLVLEPANPFAWSRLAFMRADRLAPGREVVAPLIMSLDTGPNMRQLWRGRTRLMMLYAPSMTPDELYTVRHQLNTIWTYGPSERPSVLEAAHALNRLPLLRWALGDDPEAMAELETMERNSRYP